MFKLNSVSMSYGKASILRNMTTEIPTDAFVSIMGPSGSGKSTLLRLLSFLEPPTNGHVILNLSENHNYSSAQLPARPWPHMTSVFQRQFLWPHMTLRENITLPVRFAEGSLKAQQAVSDIIDMFKMGDFVDRFPNEVSGGQAQRAALARAFILKPRLILIDEAFNGLDLEQQLALNNHFRSLRKLNVGLIVVSHSLDFSRSYADHIVVIDGGKIVDQGGKDVLLHPKSLFLKRVQVASNEETPI